MNIKIIFIIIILSLTLVSCKNSFNNEPDIVKISIYKNNYSDYALMNNVIDEITKYAKEKNIKIDIKEYSLEELSYDDYVMKRNVDIFTGESDISFGTINDLYPLKKMSGDYTRIKTYGNLMDNYKGSYCIPLAFIGHANFLNKEIFDKYNINTDNVITKFEYYECKQNMKAAGARFRLNEVEYMELVDYYSLKYNFLTEKDGKYYLKKDNLKSALKGICQDLKENYSSFNLKNLKLKNIDEISDYQIIDEKTDNELFNRSKEPISISNFNNLHNKLINYSKIYTNSKILISGVNDLKYMPCLFINNKSSDKAYELATVLFENEFAIKIINEGIYTPVIDTSEVRELLGVDEKWEYIYKNDVDKNKFEVELINEYYKMIKTADSSTYFENNNFNNYFQKFLYFETIKIFENPDYIKEIDKVIDEFDINLQIQKN